MFEDDEMEISSDVEIAIPESSPVNSSSLATSSSTHQQSNEQTTLPKESESNNTSNNSSTQLNGTSRRLKSIKQTIILSTAFPLLLHPTTAQSFVKSTGNNEIIKTINAEINDKNDKNDGNDQTANSNLPNYTYSRPTFLPPQSSSINVNCSFSDFNEIYSVHSLMKVAVRKWLLGKDRNIGNNAIPITSSSIQPSLLSTLLMTYLQGITQSSQTLQTFLSTLESIVQDVKPCSLFLTQSEQQYHNQLITICENICKQSYEQQQAEVKGRSHRKVASSLPELPGSSVSSTSLSLSANDLQILQTTLIQYYLAHGSLSSVLQCINFVLSYPTDSLPLKRYITEWCDWISQRSKAVLRVSRYKHSTDLSSSTLKVNICCSFSSVHQRENDQRKLHTGRRWDWEDGNNNWERYSELTSQILEEAYQAGKTTVDFQVEGKSTIYRADFSRMIQKNLTTGTERPLRSLLALLIKESSGRIAQTVEINMPHDTCIRELRKELAKYLQHDEKLLRMMYGSRVLRREEYQDITIKDAIVPLGAQPLVVSKMNKGDSEDLCTFVLTGQQPVTQPFYECLTCDFVHGRGFCALCASVCHRGHEIRLVSSTIAHWCHCGAGAGGDEMPCKATGEQSDYEQYYTPRMTSSIDGAHIYILSAEYGLLKIGTGENNTVTGQLYAQNSQMSVHTGASIVCTDNALLMRSPLLGSNILLKIDPVSLLFLDERIVLKPTKCNDEDSKDPNMTGTDDTTLYGIDQSSCMTSSLEFDQTVPTGVIDFEYCTRSSDDQTEQNEEELLKEQSSSETNWQQLPEIFSYKLKTLFTSNWSYGTILYLNDDDRSMMSVIIEEEGMFVRIPAKLGVKRCKIRMKQREHIMPIFYDCNQKKLLVLNLGDLPATTSTTTSTTVSTLNFSTPQKPLNATILQQQQHHQHDNKEEKETVTLETTHEKQSKPPTIKRPIRRREHALAVDTYSLPSSETFMLRYCSKCGTAYQSSSQSSIPFFTSSSSSTTSSFTLSPSPDFSPCTFCTVSSLLNESGVSASDEVLDPEIMKHLEMEKQKEKQRAATKLLQQQLQQQQVQQQQQQQQEQQSEAAEESEEINEQVGSPFDSITESASIPDYGLSSDFSRFNDLLASASSSAIDSPAALPSPTSSLQSPARSLPSNFSSSVEADFQSSVELMEDLRLEEMNRLRQTSRQLRQQLQQHQQSHQQEMIQTLQGMGFTSSHAERALFATGEIAVGAAIVG